MNFTMGGGNIYMDGGKNFYMWGGAHPGPTHRKFFDGGGARPFFRCHGGGQGQIFGVWGGPPHPHPLAKTPGDWSALSGGGSVISGGGSAL